MLIGKNLFFNDETSKTKEEILDKISTLMVKQSKYLDNKEVIFDGFLKREQEFSTGIGDEVAIPHTEIEGLKKAKVCLVKLSNPIEWNSIDKKPVKVVIAIMVPKGGRGEHLQILAKLSANLVKADFINKIKNNPITEGVELINSIKIDKDGDEDKSKNNKVDDSNSKRKYVIGITACPTGIAHTFMAKQKLVDAADELEHEYKIETQGADGIKNKLTVEDIERADAIVISTGIKLEFMERFEGYENKIFEFGLQDTIAKPEIAIREALILAEAFNSGDEAKTAKLKLAAKNDSTITSKSGKISSAWKTGMGHVMTGIGAMIPVLLVAGFLMAIGNIGALPWTLNGDETISIGDSTWASSGNAWVNIMYYTNQIGAVLMKFMYPVFAMYLAYSIGGKLALIPGFLGGLMAQGIVADYADADIYASNGFAWAYPNGFIASGFFGAIIIGFAIGYLAKYLNQKIQFSPNLIALKTMLIIPLILTIFTVSTMMFLINPFFGRVNYWMQELFVAAGDGGMFLYQSLIAGGTAFDLGGPINKAAGAVANSYNGDAMISLTETISWATDNSGTPELYNGILSDGTAFITDDELSAINSAVVYAQTFSITSRTLAIIIPPIGVGVAAMSGNAITKRDLFTKEEQQIGGTAMFLGVIGISEGAIPFMLKYPLIIISANIIGSIFGSIVALSFGSIQQLPLPAIWGWFLIGATTPAGAYGVAPLGMQIAGYIIGLTLGVLLTASIIIGSLFLTNEYKNKDNKFKKIEKIRRKLERENLLFEETEQDEIMGNLKSQKLLYKSQNAIISSKIYIENSAKKNKTELVMVEIPEFEDNMEQHKINFGNLKYKINMELGKLAKEKYHQTKITNKIELIDVKNSLLKEKIKNSNSKDFQDSQRYLNINKKITIHEENIAILKEEIVISKARQEEIRIETGGYLNKDYSMILIYEKHLQEPFFPTIVKNEETKKMESVWR